MRILSWNVMAIGGIKPDRLGRVLDAISSEAPDMITLQEVSSRGDTWPRFRDTLRASGYEHVGFSGRADALRLRAHKEYGNIVASRFALAFDDTSWAPGAPCSQLLARAIVDMPGGHRAEVLTVHAPNGSSNGWRKIETLEAVARHLETAPEMPRVLTGDFNEPASIDPIRSFGQIVHAAEPTLEGNLTRLGERYPRRRWDDAVLALFRSRHVRHTWFNRHGPKWACTHVVRGKQRFFDHILASDHFEVVDAGFHHAWRESSLSDHSAAWAELRMHPRSGPS
jgi:endonuclease/exonuclease/phosphatase family metal-dependent hydrolase